MTELVTVKERGDRYEVTPADREIEPSTAVVAGIEQLEAKESHELTPPLAAYVDPGALDAVIDGLADGMGSVEFTAWGYHVRVEPDLGVTLDPGRTSRRLPRNEPANDK
jgi:hypothetical protein